MFGQQQDGMKKEGMTLRLSNVKPPFNMRRNIVQPYVSEGPGSR
jgi:hypothetical protein